MLNKLYLKKPTDLYKILLVYNKHLINPIRQDYEFLNNFICYTIKNENFDTFIIGLIFINSLENYIDINKKNINDIFKACFETENETDLQKKDKKDKYFIEPGNNLKFKIEKFEEEEMMEAKLDKE